MKIIRQLLLAAAFVAIPNLAFADNHELAREPHGIDTIVPGASPSPARAARKITIYTAKTIVTLDPGTPTAEAVAVMDGKILGVGTLDEVRGWVTNQERGDRPAISGRGDRPGLHRSAHAPADHRRAVAGRLCRPVRPDRARRHAVKGLETKQAVLDRLKDGGCQDAGRRRLADRLGLPAGILRRLAADARRSRSDLQRAPDLRRKPVDAHLLRQQQGVRDRRHRRRHRHRRDRQEGRQADRRDRGDQGRARLRRQAAAARRQDAG